MYKKHITSQTTNKEGSYEKSFISLSSYRCFNWMWY